MLSLAPFVTAALALSSFASCSYGMPDRPVQLKNAAEWSTDTLSKLGDNVHINTQWEFNDCGSPEDVVEIKSLDISPDPPEPGKELSIHATGTVKEVIDEGAYADVVVKLGLIKLLTKRFDLCEELSKSNATLQCPIQPGDYDITQNVELPREIPRAKFNVHADAYTQPPEEAHAACADIIIDFMKPNV